MSDYRDELSFNKSCKLIFLFLIFISAIAFCIAKFIPDNSMLPSDENIIVQLPEDTKSSDENLDYTDDYVDEVSFISLDNVKDKGLSLYRQSMTRSAVEWFYTQITGDSDVTLAILTEADKNDIPLSLAFALAHTESKFKTHATGYNTNGTIDRGIFQLNSNSFPQLTEDDFYDPYISAKYGLSHLKLCLRTAGNKVSALAMYNAGTGRVSTNRTPQTTLNYIGKIISYQDKIENLFTQEVVIFYETQISPSFED